MPSRQTPKNVPRIFFQVKRRRRKLFCCFLPPPLAPPPLAAILAAARPPPSGAPMTVVVAPASPPDERWGAARRPPRCRARLSSARPMAPVRSDFCSVSYVTQVMSAQQANTEDYDKRESVRSVAA